MQFPVNLLGFSPVGRFAKNVKGREMCNVMEKINYRKQELDLVDRLLRIIEAGSVALRQVREPATNEQLWYLSRLGIYPKWTATRQEASEMIALSKLV